MKRGIYSIHPVDSVSSIGVLNPATDANEYNDETAPDENGVHCIRMHEIGETPGDDADDVTREASDGYGREIHMTADVYAAASDVAVADVPSKKVTGSASLSAVAGKAGGVEAAKKIVDPTRTNS